MTTASFVRELSVARRHPRLRLKASELRAAVAVLDAHREQLAPRGGRPFPGELSLVFLTDAALARLHDDFLDDPTTTDVITFEGEPASGFGGEICVSVDTAARYAREHRRDFSAELTLYLVHGWLHLAGHDDLEPGKKRAMRRAEARALTLLRKHGSLPRFTLQPKR